MITKPFFKDVLLVVALSIILTIFLTRPGFSQDTLRNNGSKKMMIYTKIIDDQDGKKVEFDTTINIDPSMKPCDVQKMINTFEKKFKDHGMMMHSMEFDLPDMDKPGMEEFTYGDSQNMLNHEDHGFSREENQSLNDFLGDIPMNMVKRYSVKDTKDGKKITIELKREPIVENRREVIIMRPSKTHGKSAKVRIESSED